jgi:hypothetical protein
VDVCAIEQITCEGRRFVEACCELLKGERPFRIVCGERKLVGRRVGLARFRDYLRGRPSGWNGDLPEMWCPFLR